MHCAVGRGMYIYARVQDGICACLQGCVHANEREGVGRSGEAERQVLILSLPPINPAGTEGLGRSVLLRLWSCQR